jgi:alpha-L-arabinofuranosidase
VGSKDHVLHLKLVNASTTAQPLAINLDGVGAGATGRMETLHAATYEATNSIDHPDVIRPVSSTVKVSGAKWAHTVPPLTIEVIDLPLR